MSASELLVILGPTAAGKTKLAAQTAFRLNGEIISADSRQVYRNMNIGTGKDYSDYFVNTIKIPCHCIDIAEPGTEYNVFQYQHDFFCAYENIKVQNKFPILCGGTGMYLEAVLRGYNFIEVPENHALRESLQNKPLEELVTVLASFRKLHSTTDTSDKNRTIRAIEIAVYSQSHPEKVNENRVLRATIVGINIQREKLRQRITERLQQRMEAGMTEEVEHLLSAGILPEKLIRYGLEYKFITLYLLGKLSYENMFRQLNIAIHQFAKRQMTWFRRMEKTGLKIYWIDGFQPTEKIIDEILEQKFKITI